MILSDRADLVGSPLRPDCARADRDAGFDPLIDAIPRAGSSFRAGVVQIQLGDPSRGLYKRGRFWLGTAIAARAAPCLPARLAQAPTPLRDDRRQFKMASPSRTKCFRSPVRSESRPVTGWPRLLRKPYSDRINPVTKAGEIPEASPETLPLAMRSGRTTMRNEFRPRPQIEPVRSREPADRFHAPVSWSISVRF